jgi:hypothetical protein
MYPYVFIKSVILFLWHLWNVKILIWFILDTDVIVISVAADLELALLQVGQNSAGVINSKIDTPNVKKRHRRAKSSGPKNDASQVDGK